MSVSEKERENMSLYSVLLVDDEEEVFQVIMKKLDWEGMGFRIAGYARNGVEALEMAEELSVDVVMTDIKMPYMDGLTLCRKLKEQYQKIKVIIFSGFDEFEYAREAIKIEAEEYILKPICARSLGGSRTIWTRNWTKSAILTSFGNIIWRVFQCCRRTS